MTTREAGLLPDEPIPVRLMNTIWADRSGVHDALATPADLRAWLAATHPAANARGADPDRFRALRDALRRLAALLTGDHRPAAASVVTDARRAVAEINEAAALAFSWPQLALWGGALRHAVTGTATPGERLLSDIARAAVDLLAGEHRVEIRACYAPGCVLYFVRDHPRREWCSTACGNRARVARHYDRHRRQGPTAAH